MKIRVPEKIYGVTELYDTVATTMGYKNLSNLHYDCREINVAMNIQENFFAYYREQNPQLSETDLNLGVAMLLLDYGPKTDETLSAYEVEVSDKFIC